MLHRVFLGRITGEESAYLRDVLRHETVGGAILLGAAVVALVWANSPWQGAYDSLRHAEIGADFATLHLRLSVETWAADGLLAVFFFVAGLELKRELTVGELRRPADAMVPVAAAVAGMAVPALVYLAVSHGTDGADRGWAIPMATDIAFALAVLAVAGPAIPAALRAFLLTLAVVDDLGAILVIALFYTSAVEVAALLGAVALLAGYALLQHRGIRTPLVHIPLGLAVWVLVHESGVHATVAGVALGLLTDMRRPPEGGPSPAERLEHRVRPISAGIAVPVFALLAAGVPVSGSALERVLDDRAALAVVVGLVVGKAVGVFCGAFLAARLTRAELSPDLGWADVLAVGVVGGAGFTVSLLIAELAFATDDARTETVKAAVLLGSLIAAVLGGLLIRRRHRHHLRNGVLPRTLT